MQRSKLYQVTTTYINLPHARYGHLRVRKLKQLIQHMVTSGKSSIQLPAHMGKSLILDTCDACMGSKIAHVKSTQQMRYEATRPNGVVVADLSGALITVQSSAGGHVKYYLSAITDVYSRHVNAMIINSKDKASDHVIPYYHASVINTDNPLRHFHTDGGTEYNRAERVLTMRGTKVTRTPIDTAQLPYATFYQEAIATAVYLHNRVTIVGSHGTQSINSTLVISQTYLVCVYLDVMYLYVYQVM
jgi:hypothetical protein